MTDSPPRPSVTPSSIILSAPDRSVTVPLEIVNRGGGRLSATLRGGHAWLKIEPRTIQDNHVRVAVTVDATILPEGETTSSSLYLEWDKFSLEIPVRVTRQGLGQAWRLYENGRRQDARELATAVAETSPRPEAPLLIAICLLEEESYAAAVRPLRDATTAVAALDDHGPADALAKAITRRFLDMLSVALPHLRDARYCTSLLEEMEALAEESDPTLLSTLDPLVLDAARRFAEAYPPSVLPKGDLDASRAFIERMRRRDSDDGRWQAWLDLAAQLPAHTPLLTAPEPVEEKRRSPLPALVFVASLAAAALALYVWSSWGLRETRSLLTAGRHVEALQALQRATANGIDSSESRALRIRIYQSWAQRLFADGAYRDGLDRLTLALREAPDSAELQALARSSCREWARTAEAQGRILDACDALQRLSTMQPPEPDAAARLIHLRPLQEIYRVLGELVLLQRNSSPQPDAPSHPLNGSGGPRRGAWKAFMKKHGLGWYDGPVQIGFVTLGGDGHQQLIIAGSNRDGRGGVLVYAPKTDGRPRMLELHTAELSTPCTFKGLKTSEGKTADTASVVEARFAGRSGADGETIAVAAQGSRITHTTRASETRDRKPTRDD